jgi:hypothetical protein
MFARKSVAPYCSVCERAGEPSSVFNNHNPSWVYRSGRSCGMTMCPTQKANTCDNCFKCGHFARTCKSKPVDFIKILHKKSPVVKAKTVAPVYVSNSFGNLIDDEDDDDDDDDDDEVEAVVGKKRHLAEIEPVAADAPKPLSYLDVAKSIADPTKGHPVDTQSDYIRPKYTNYKLHDWSDEEYWESRDAN